MGTNDQAEYHDQENQPGSLAEAVIASLALRDLYGIRRLYPEALPVGDAREIHRLLVEHLSTGLRDSHFDAIRENLYCEPCFDEPLTEGKLSLIFGVLVAHCPNVQIVGKSEKAIAESIDQGVKWSHERCSPKLQGLLLQLFEIKTYDCRISSSKDDLTKASMRVDQRSGEDVDGAYCRVITREGKRAANKLQYEKLVDARDEYDMFIDGMTQKASCRHDNQKPRVEKLTPKELGILSDFIQAGKPMRPYNTRTGKGCASISSACRLFVGARKKVDVKLGRYRYRAFRLHKDCDDSKFNAHEFSPPNVFLYCLILPA